MQAFKQRRSTVAQHQTGFQAKRVLKYFDDVFNDEWLAAGKTESIYAELHCFIEIRFNFIQLESLQTRIPRPRPFQAERTFEIAGGAGVNPQLAQALQLDYGENDVHASGAFTAYCRCLVIDVASLADVNVKKLSM